jgi:hypothetical protein
VGPREELLEREELRVLSQAQRQQSRLRPSSLQQLLFWTNKHSFMPKKVSRLNQLQRRQ